MAKKPIFKPDFAEASGPADPEALFRTVRGRAPEIKRLWSQQADLLRAYHQQHVTSSDVAIELPTGAGKTLAGLLIAEWRRQARGSETTSSRRSSTRRGWPRSVWRTHSRSCASWWT